MNVIEAPADRVDVDEAQLLFEEARQRRRRRWLISGIVILVGLLVLGTVLASTSWRGRNTPAVPATTPHVVGAASRSAADFSVRPVLCLAPAATKGAGAPATGATLPACAAASALTQSNLDVTPSPAAYTSNLDRIPDDMQFAEDLSTPATHEGAGATVLLPGASGTGRYVLGPDVQSAEARETSGQWTVALHLTGPGAAKWDSLAQQQFHAIVGVVVNNRVISAPVIQPTQVSFASFDGQLQLDGGFTEQQARTLAANL